MRADGEPTYFAADVAYHEDKLERGYDRLIDVLGADHHGYVARMKAAIAGARRRPGPPRDPLIMQFVHIVEGGERAQMSKRRGDFVTLDELIDEIGVDATRWFMLCALARHDGRPRPRAGPAASRPRTRSTTSSTRTRGSLGILRKAGERAGRGARSGARRARTTLHESERELSSSCWRSRTRCARRPSGARRTGSPPTRSSSPQIFTAFYRDCQVVGSTPRRSRPAAAALRRHAADDRAVARAARRLGARADVAGRRAAGRGLSCGRARAPARAASRGGHGASRASRACPGRSRPRRGGCRGPGAAGGAARWRGGGSARASTPGSRAALRGGRAGPGRPLPVRISTSASDRSREAIETGRCARHRASLPLRTPHASSDPISSAPENDAAAANVSGWRAA